jgi:hypothetical protein
MNQRKCLGLTFSFFLMVESFPLLDKPDPQSTNHESKRIRRNLYADDGNVPAAQPGYPVIVAGWAETEIVNE